MKLNKLLKSAPKSLNAKIIELWINDTVLEA